MEKFEGLTAKQWMSLYGYQDVIDPSFKFKLRPLSDLKPHEVVAVCAKAAPISFITYETREILKWTAIPGVDNLVWTVDCEESSYYFTVTATDESGFCIYAFNKVAAGTVISNPIVITEWASAIALLVSYKIDVFNLKRFKELKIHWYTTIEPTVEAVKERDSVKK